jgi:hypothetical protein
MSKALERENLALRDAERWRPPIFVPVAGRRGRLMAALRRFFDLQAGSLSHDLAPVPSKATGTVVDVGCGAQPYRGLLPSETRYIGLDSDRALEQFGYSMPDILPITEDNRWPVHDDQADLVLATETLEHVADPEAGSFPGRGVSSASPGGPCDPHCAVLSALALHTSRLLALYPGQPPPAPGMSRLHTDRRAWPGQRNDCGLLQADGAAPSNRPAPG